MKHLRDFNRPNYFKNHLKLLKICLELLLVTFDKNIMKTNKVKFNCYLCKMKI